MTKDTTSSTELVAQIRGEIPVRIGDPKEAAMAIVERILSAPDIESIFNMQGTLGADDILNVGFMLKGVEFRKSDYLEGSPVYAIMTAEVDGMPGEQVITCGGSNVCAQLAAADKFGLPPFPLMLTRPDRPTSNGFYPLWLQDTRTAHAA